MSPHFPSPLRTVPRPRALLFAPLLAALLLAGLAGPARAATVDVLFVYDTTATSWVASNGGMEAFSQDAVNRMNQAMTNSGVDLTFRVVHSMSANYTAYAAPLDYYGFLYDLTALRTGSDNLAAVHTARDAYGADLVTMMVDTGSAYYYVGLGYLLNTWSGLPDYAYTVCAIRSVDISHTLTHEVGHNFGADHSKYQVDGPGPNDDLSTYSAGWYFTGTNSVKYHTIMAYDSDGHGNTYTEAPLFSTPLVTYQGTAAGDAAEGDNARLLREIMSVVGRYRNPPVKALPAINLLLLGD